MENGYSTNHVASNEFKFSSQPTLEDIRSMQSKFAKERNWDQYHQPRNLVLALVGEVGELAEIFQWKGEVEVGLKDWTTKEKDQLADELSDVLCYLVRLADRCGVDLPTAAAAKIEKNRLKYPAEKVFGDSRKYDEYEDQQPKLN
ncbi:dCTP pyrophosphatase 1 [Chamberlinius hualienensis]